MSESEYAVVGKGVTRIDGAVRVTGKAVFGDDVSLPGLLHGKVLRSPHAHARILRLDTGKAEQLPGVQAVITAKDAPETPSGGMIKDRWIFARDKVRYMGEPLAAVAAPDPHVAEAALLLIEVEYEVLPAVIDPRQAAEAPPALVHEAWESYRAPATLVRQGNVANYAEVKVGDVDQGFRESDVIFEGRYEVAMAHQGYIEPHVAVAKVEPDGKITVWTTTQGQFTIRNYLAEALQTSHSKIRLIGTEIGGGFGGKNTLVLEPPAVLLSRKTGRPVKMIMDREEDFLSTTPRRPCIVELKTGVKRDGTLVARHAKFWFGTGAYATGGFDFSANVAPRMSGPYRIPHLFVQGYTVYTNQPPCAAFRAPGSPQIVFAYESHMEEMARALGMDSIEFRKQNALKKGDPTRIGPIQESADLAGMLERAAEESGWRTKPKGKNRGRGIGCAFWTSGGMPGSNAVKLNEDGSVSVMTGSVDVTGTHTTLAQIVAEEMGISMDRIQVTTGDTDNAPVAPISAGSNIARSMGYTVKKATEALRLQLLETAAEALEANVNDLDMQGGRVYVKGSPDKGMTMRELYTRSATQKGGPPVASFSSKNLPPSVNYTIQVAEVEVDPDTGEVKLLDLTALQDVGFALNPLSVEGQIQGGAVQGVGYALSEEMKFGKDGKLMNPNLLDYKIPSILDVPRVKPVLIEEPLVAGPSPYGAKGVGEPPIVPTAAAIGNAIYDAVGVRITSLPLSAEKVLKALKEKK
ncbi:MAG: xanthine dehydrogenase family protein molybdopterin-binding subunit [Nitrospinae bacterium]|nr:xanthine dehydrogenase family protein molybdopterin-binding subunit [Nitrospinota bacterium]